MYRKFEIDALLLDLDGTIIDSTGVYHDIVAEVLATQGLPPVSRQTLINASVNGEFDWAGVFPPHMDHGPLIRCSREIAAEIFPAVFSRKVHLIPGTIDILTRASQRGVKLAIVTSTPKKNMPLKLKPLEKSGVVSLFSEILTADDTPRLKPAADPLIECCRRLGASTPKSAYVGDMRLDIKAGKAAGTRTIGVLTGFDDYAALEKEAPDAILNSIVSLPEVLHI